MSISDKLNTLLTTKNAIKQALINKGQEVSDVFSEYPQIIENMDVGSSGNSGNSGEWQPPADWPDVEQILIDTPLPSGASGSFIYLLPNNEITTNISLTNSSYEVGALTSDGVEYGYSSSVHKHNWDTTKDIKINETEGYRWIIYFTKNTNSTSTYTGKNHYNALYLVVNKSRWNRATFKNMNLLKYIKNLQENRWYIQSFSSLFQNCYSLQGVSQNLIWGNNVETEITGSKMFYNCYSLIKVPNLSQQIKINAFHNMFYNCFSLNEIPTLNTASTFSGLMMGNLCFQGCYSLTFFGGFSTQITNSISIYAPSFLTNASVQKIIDNLVVIPSTWTGTYTLTLNSSVVSKMTEEQKKEITDKGWTLQ